jgi:hypothetical protein
MSSTHESVLAAVRARDFRRTTFQKQHRPTLRAVAEAIVTAETPIPEARMSEFLDDFDDYISRSSKTLRFGFLLLLQLVRVLPPFMLARFALFEDLSMDDRVRMLERMESHRITLLALVFVAFKTPMMIVWFEDPLLLAEIGYPGEERSRYKRLLPVIKPEAA